MDTYGIWLSVGGQHMSIPMERWWIPRLFFSLLICLAVNLSIGLIMARFVGCLALQAVYQDATIHRDISGLSWGWLSVVKPSRETSQQMSTSHVTVKKHDECNPIIDWLIGALWMFKDLYNLPPPIKYPTRGTGDVFQPTATPFVKWDHCDQWHESHFRSTHRDGTDYLYAVVSLQSLSCVMYGTSDYVCSILLLISTRSLVFSLPNVVNCVVAVMVIVATSKVNNLLGWHALSSTHSEAFKSQILNLRRAG